MGKMSNNNFYRTGSRKFHDAPAFIGYVVVTLIVNSIYILYGNQSTKPKNFSFPMPTILIASGICLVTLVCFMFISFLLFPEFMLHFGCLAGPLLLIAIALLSNESMFIIMSCIGAGISLFIYFFYLRKNIKYTATILKASTKIIMKNILGIVTIIFISSCLQILQLFILLMNENKKVENNFFLYFIFILQSFWTLANIAYFMRVYVGTIISLTLFKDTAGEFSSLGFEALKNSLLALGSICLGGFLLALVTTLRLLLDKNEHENRERRNIAGQIFAMILSVLLSILEDIIKCANDWSFSYLAVHGKSYVESVKGSWNVVIRGKNSVLINSLCITPILGIFQILFVAIYAFIIGLTVSDIPELFSETRIIGTASTIFITMFSLISFAAIFDAATKSFLFSYAEDSSVVNDLPKVKEALREQDSK
ncbi:Protein PNS1 [Astathelohania contejeani]|uniref:Protein PNS1 n=1 Tax=Astathelohania contejeani TaxID=164912 RepID=A0ABQ7HX98_9MICR|nr:Protein PNS1 [Thelohania contejeani]